MNYDRVVVTGSIAFDHIMSMPGHFKDHILPDKIHAINVSFIMESFRKEYGGTGGNMTYSLGLLGVPVAMVGSAGMDFTDYKKKLDAISCIDTSGVGIHPQHVCSQGFVMTDRDDNQVWGFFEGAMKEEVHLNLKGLLKPRDFLIVGPTNPVAMMQFVRDAIDTKTPYMFDPAFNIAHFNDEDMKEAIKHCLILIGNDYEIEMIRRKVRMPDEEFFDMNRIVVTTFGSKGSEIRHGQIEHRINVPHVDNVLDPTGAGDGYRAGFVAAYFRTHDLEVCGRVASISAAYAVENYGTQNQNYTLEEFSARYASAYQAELGWTSQASALID